MRPDWLQSSEPHGHQTCVLLRLSRSELLQSTRNNQFFTILDNPLTDRTFYINRNLSGDIFFYQEKYFLKIVSSLSSSPCLVRTRGWPGDWDVLTRTDWDPGQHYYSSLLWLSWTGLDWAGQTAVSWDC